MSFDLVTGRVRTAYVFVATLSFSRHQYAELIFDQKVATWIGLHYGFLISPTLPATPRHKGKVENGVHYVQRNFMAGQEFAGIRFANQHLRKWLIEVAGIRQHGATHQPPLRLFREIEQVALLPLPEEPFSLCEIRVVKVHPDCHAVISGSYYSVPYTYVGQKQDAFVRERVVEVYQGQQLIATHVRCQQPGQWQTRLEHYPPHKAAYLQRTPDFCRKNAEQIGPAARQVVETLLFDRPLERLTSVQVILRLEQSLGPQRLEAACARAVYYGDVNYRRIKAILNAALDRLTHHAHTLILRGDTYRQRSRRKEAAPITA